MSNGSSERPANAEQLSALVDGELPDADVASCCGTWRQDGDLRRRWHAYQLIGDVLRSDDLASDPARDAAFMDKLRTRLAGEPVVLAPAAALAPAAVPRFARRRWGWRAPSAVAAGFVAVAGTVVVLQRPVQAPAEAVARSAAPAPQVAAMPVAALPAAASRPSVEMVVESPTVVSNPKIIRDAGLDRYLSAHKQFAGSSALGASSGYLRAATVDGAPR